MKEEYSATCVCVRGRARACVDEAVPQTITEGVTATVGVLVCMIEGFVLRQSSVLPTLHRTLRNRWKGIDRERGINNDVRGNN